MAAQTAHVAIRSCKVCRARKPKAELQRWVLDDKGLPVHDMGAVMNGRGTYLCSQDCYNKVYKHLQKMLLRRRER